MSYQSPDLTFAEDLGTEVVDIYAGNKHYLVHKRLLTSKSDYFEKALNGQFKEAAENTIHLEDVEPTAVALLIGWLYRGSIPGMDRKLSPFTRSARTSLEESLPVPNAISINGTLVGYTPLQEMRDTIFGVSFFERFCHISAQPPYSSFSQEELRIADYIQEDSVAMAMVSNRLHSQFCHNL
ncbi:hypothetical protein B0O99DRAFT_282193 [Bisporella sp. PMI_857]|nr:hypothetical protein B0O99DRAFT_282193 [Bisporella sp. PMI_857]